jgi:DNA modification methylase
MKPVGLLRRLILNGTKTGDAVYDPFGGSGSTLIACEDTRRRCYMIEIDPEYCQTIIARFEKHTGIKAKKI